MEVLWQPDLASPSRSRYPNLNLLWPRACGHPGKGTKVGWLCRQCLTGWYHLGGFIAVQGLGLIFFLYTKLKKGIYYNMNVTGGSDSSGGLQNQPQRWHSSGQHKSIRNHLVPQDQVRHHCLFYYWAQTLRPLHHHHRHYTPGDCCSRNFPLLPLPPPEWRPCLCRVKNWHLIIAPELSRPWEANSLYPSSQETNVEACL